MRHVAPEVNDSASRASRFQAADAMPLLTFRTFLDDTPNEQLLLRRLSEAAPPPVDVAPSGTCKNLPKEYALAPDLMRQATTNGTVFVTFSDKHLSAFALNWARRLQVVGLRSLVGVSERLDASAEKAAKEAGALLFCAEKAGLMAANGQAGRWAEAVPVLRMARKLSLSVLLSDADIAWIRNPLPYFAAARASHPRADLLMMTDRAFNGYSSMPLSVQPRAVRGGSVIKGTAAAALPSQQRSSPAWRRDEAFAPKDAAWRADESFTRGAGGGGGGGEEDFVELELEPGFESSISYNIGVILFCDHALRHLEAMITRWVAAVGGSGGGGSGGGGRKGKGPKLAVWDQDPINKQVLQVGLRPDAADKRLVRVDSGRVAMGVLPMLQFTTSFTYYMQRKRRESLRARPYCLHAIFAHGKVSAEWGPILFCVLLILLAAAAAAAARVLCSASVAHIGSIPLLPGRRPQDLNLPRGYHAEAQRSPASCTLR